MKRSYVWVPLVLFTLFAAYERTWANHQARAEAAALRERASVRFGDPFAGLGLDGRAEAEADLARGEPKWKTYGLRDAVGAEHWRHILRERFGVEEQPIAREYNNMIRRDIVRRHGADALAQAFKDASGQ